MEDGIILTILNMETIIMVRSGDQSMEMLMVGDTVIFLID
jgi:hypothetical protein